MKHIRQRLCDKLPRVKQIIFNKGNTAADIACNVCYWGVAVTLLYGYLLQYNMRGNAYDIDK
jgi:hypothetical protein